MHTDLLTCLFIEWANTVFLTIFWKMASFTTFLATVQSALLTFSGRVSFYWLSAFTSPLRFLFLTSPVKRCECVPELRLIITSSVMLPTLLEMKCSNTLQGLTDRDYQARRLFPLVESCISHYRSMFCSNWLLQSQGFVHVLHTDSRLFRKFVSHLLAVLS